MLKKWLVKYKFILLAIFSTLLFTSYFFSVFSANFTQKVTSFEARFHYQENKLENFILQQKKEFEASGTLVDWKKYQDNTSLNLHVYRNDSLLFWNTNQLPIIRFADIHFPSEGIIHLQNGWYYAKLFKSKNHTVCCSFLIKNDYSYENKALINEFVPTLKIPFDASISLEPVPDFSIHSKEGKFLFSLLPNDYQPATELESQILFCLLLLTLILWLFVLARFTSTLPKKQQWLITGVLIVLRLLSLQFVWFGFMQDTQAFQASLYGTNDWFPNFFEYLVNCIFILYLTVFLRNQFLLKSASKNWKNWAIVLFILSILFWGLLLYLNKGLIENSSIPLIINRLFSLNLYSVFAIISVGILFYAYFIYTREIVRLNKTANNSALKLLSISSISGVLFLIYELNWGHQLFFAGIFPLIFNAIMVFFVFREKKRNQLGFGMTFLALFSLILALNLAEFNKRKEKSERELYANQLATEQDIVTEVEYTTIVNKIKEDNILQKFIESPMKVGISDFEDGLERRIFNGFWERYEMNFNLFDFQGNSLISGSDNQKNAFEDYNEIIKNHGSVSEIDSTIFFISDYTGQYSYIIRQPMSLNDSTSALLYCTLKSKKIPEEIGFPRLLISSKAQVFESLENYSIAKYHNNRLVTKYGGYNFPSTLNPVKTWVKEGASYYNFDGYSHYILEKSNRDVIVLSSKIFSWKEQLTSFSYLFSFYGIMLLPLLFQFNYSPLFKRTLTLAVKIQLVLIGLVFLSLLAFSWGSGIFVRNQYNEYTNDVIREKLSSVEFEIRSKLGAEKELSISEKGNYMEALLQKFSKVFITDINLYDTKGFMLASSRPKVFNMGLLSEQMNPSAMFAFLVRNRSEFVHEEKIGKLNYASAYLPFYNHDGHLLGFVNLQHFGQQKEFENQIQKFLVAIINVFMLLLAISIVLTLFISNWVTAPLRLLQENFASIRFGKHNQMISYDKEDEIGALVKDYNKKLEELEYTAQQLAQSERESAWREMAKQVAHEIKNPLTPMKLSIQQLLRVYDPADPNSEKKLEKVATSIIEQIDALTKIANEFSNFAKMPRPNEVRMDLLPVLENVLEVFRQDAKSTIELKTTLDSAIIKADKDQMVRTFNNLIKNALQSIPEDREGLITVSLSNIENTIHIEVQDNGIGISAEKRSTIFVPYFTTKSNGTGLGLAMVKQIIENHKGTIYVESEVDKGSLFIIDLPVEN
jgi:signal transduction histidine kinase